MATKTETVTYYSEGDVIVSTLYTPEDRIEGKKYPAIVICQGFTGIRTSPLNDAIAAELNDHGYVVIGLDYRGWGDSGGERGRLAPLEQVDDIRNTLTYLQTLDFVDPERLGLIGISYGCLTAPHAAAVDTRVKAVLGCLGVGTGYSAVTNIRTPEQMKEWEDRVVQARRRRVLFNDVDRCVRAIDVFRDQPSIDFLVPAWESQEAWRTPLGYDSIGRVMDHRPIDFVHKIAPRAIGLLCAEHDTCADPKSLREMFDAAQEPKRWILVPELGHFDLYGAKIQDFKHLIVNFFKEFIDPS